MNAPFLSGLTAGWAVTQVVIGVLLVVAGRRRGLTDHLLLGLLCFALAAVTAGAASGYRATHLPAWEAATKFTVTGLLVAVALNLHLVLRLSRIRNERYYALSVYAVSALFLIVHALGLWRRTEHAAGTMTWLGISVTRVEVELYLVASVYFVLAVGSAAVCIVLLVGALRRGHRDVRAALLGSVVLGVAVMHDVGLLEGLWREGICLLPHAFLLYTVLLATSLLVRPGIEEGELAATTQRLALRTEELRRSYRDLEDMEDELGRREQLAVLGELAATIAHEVRNPLAVIVNAAAGLRRPGLREDDRDMLLGIVDEEVARLNRLVTDLLRFARPVSVSWSEVDLAELAERMRTLVPENVRVLVDVPADPGLQTISVDAGLMRLVLENLVENACQAMPDGGSLTIGVRLGDLEGEVATCLEVADSGRGMDARTLERALKPFFTTRPQGTGLGLPIVDRIMRAHGGTVQVDSREGAGTRVCLMLPIDRAARRRRRAGGPGSNKTTD